MAQKNQEKAAPVVNPKGQLFLLKKDHDRLTALADKLKEQNAALENQIAELEGENITLHDVVGKYDQKIRDIEELHSEEMKLVLAEMKKMASDISMIKTDISILRSTKA